MLKTTSFIKKTVNITGLIACGVLLAACNSSGDGSKVEKALTVQPTTQQVGLGIGRPLVDQAQDPRAYCPKTILRAGTETFNIFPEGVKKEDAGSSQELRYRASITETVRECNSAGQFINIDVGIRGRFISGPKGEKGAFMLPLRIAVVRGDDVLYSELHQVWAEILPGRSNGAFTYVDKNISILKPENPNIQIFVGFDIGANSEKSKTVSN